MVSYSHSRLGTFQQCKFKYKLQYIDKVKVDIPDTVETFMGGWVHNALEKLYSDLQHEKLISKEELLDYFEENWTKNWVDKIIINSKDYTQENYLLMGKRFISDYYDHYKPFDQVRTIGLETQDFLHLENGNSYHIRIDRLAKDSDNNYYVCDYKTNKKLKDQGELDEDKQLAMYSLWVRDKFDDVKDVKLVWYFLAHDKEMVSERSDEQLLSLNQDVESLIEVVESTTEFPTHVTPLCNWCIYKQVCPEWKHELEVESESPQEYSKDDGVKFVEEYAELSVQRRETESRLREVESSLVDFAKQKGVNAVFSSSHKCSVKEQDKIVYPQDKEAFISVLKEKGVYQDFIVLNYLKLNSAIKKKELDEEILKLVKRESSFRVSLSKR